MGKRHKFQNSIIHILAHNKDGSYRTRSDRQTYLLAMAKELFDAGYQLDHIRYIKSKHIWYLVNKMRNDLSPGTVKNRMSHLRWLMTKVNKERIVPSNDTLRIARRCYIPKESKAKCPTETELARIPSPMMRLSLEAQVLFGLRVEESLKIKPCIADKGDSLYIKGSWAKGGRARLIPVRTTQQREWLMRAKALLPDKKSSLIPQGVSYKTYRSRFSKACQRAGIFNCHGHRHYYAQKRYSELKLLEPVDSDSARRHRENDAKIRLQVSEELGHSRADITKVYL